MQSLPTRSRRTPASPRLETLEDRCVLSAGDLDPTFGTGGLVTTQVGTGSLAYAVAVLPGGKILAAGEAGSSKGDQFALARYTSAGALDTTFGTGGKVTTSIGDKGKNAHAEAAAMAVDPATGKILLAGRANGGNKGYDNFALARYNANGTLDTSFGTGGTVTTSVTAHCTIAAVLLQPDGKIVAVGESRTGALGPSSLTLARYNANGSLDTTFDGDGKVVSTLGSESWARGAALQADGKIVVAGNIVIGGQIHFAVARYTTSGTLDPTFDGDGYTSFSTNHNGGDVGAHDVVVQPDGRIVAVGRGKILVSTNPDVYEWPWIVARYNTNGSFDTSFNVTGAVYQSFPGAIGTLTSAALQPDGKIVVAGQLFANETRNVTVGRYNTDGSLDATFAGGIVSTAFGAVGSRAQDVAIQPDGKVVAAGYTYDGKFALARYQGDGVAPADSTLAALRGNGASSGSAQASDTFSTLDAVAVSLVLERAQRRKG